MPQGSFEKSLYASSTCFHVFELTECPIFSSGILPIKCEIIFFFTTHGVLLQSNYNLIKNYILSNQQRKYEIKYNVMHYFQSPCFMENILNTLSNTCLLFLFGSCFSLYLEAPHAIILANMYIFLVPYIYNFLCIMLFGILNLKATLLKWLKQLGKVFLLHAWLTFKPYNITIKVKFSPLRYKVIASCTSFV